MKILTPIKFLIITAGFTAIVGSTFALEPTAEEIVEQYKQDDVETLRKAKALYEQSQATLDERLAWWEEARFGMFVHFGAYAELAGKWKGNLVHAYSSHIMRSHKITKAEYMEAAVEEFNPQRFDADEWIQLCQAAGMKYFVITAKHHDGFAIWDSDYPYNIVDQTSFNRDLLKELRDACKKHGIRFGVYYSHAQDWHHEGGQRNQADYPNHPNRAGWFRQDKYMPHLLKTREYVDEKAIPQLEELITEYQPEIIWFDTGFWLPPWELSRIYVRTRELDPNVIISSRIGLGLGDYASTGDKPVDFPPVAERYWEAIPTMNEAYAYNPYDDSYKSASHFIELLTKCVAQGGNLLLNVGPKEDGTIPPTDTNVLLGIGKWMAVNSGAIYGCGQSTLPMQSWGYVTQGIREDNSDKINLLIDRWPVDGKLLVHGLKDLPETVTAFAWREFELKAERHGDDAILIDLPKHPLDAVMSVIQLKFSSTPTLENGPQRLLKNIDANEIHVFYSDDRSKTIRDGNGTSHGNTVFGWVDPSQFISWDVYSGESASYRVEVTHYAKNPSFSWGRKNKISNIPVGEELIFSAGETTLKAVLTGGAAGDDEATVEGDAYDGDSKNVELLTTVLGEVLFPAGAHRLTLRVSDFPESTGFFPQTIRLVPIN